jgi:hypothetical protein
VKEKEEVKEEEHTIRICRERRGRKAAMSIMHTTFIG